MSESVKREVYLPFEEWTAFVDASCCVGIASEGPKTEDEKSANGKAAVAEGLLLLTTSVVHGPLESSVSSSWRLVSPMEWAGETRKVMHDDVAIAQGVRQRGCYTGCLVRVRQREYVIAEAVSVKASLPSQRAVISIEAAKEYYAQHESPYVKEKHPMSHWEFLHGHPVCVIAGDKDSPKSGFLYCRIGKRISRLFIRNIEVAKQSVSSAIALGDLSCQPSVQLALFE